MASKPRRVPHSVRTLLLYLKKRHGTDYRTAKELSVSTGELSSWRKGRYGPSDRHALQLAILCPEFSPEYVLALVAADRAKRLGSGELAMRWRNVCRRLGPDKRRSRGRRAGVP